jgi:hypothetical protein
MPSELTNVQVKRLLSGVSVHGDWHLAEVEQDLVQMDVLLDEAIKKLYASFMAIHHVVGVQQQALDGMLADGASAAECAARLEALRNEIGQHVGAAVTGLQFQDMTSQLIGRMVQHLAGLRDVFSVLGANGANALPENGSAEILATLGRIGERVAADRDRPSGIVRSAVNQRHMESGDIELF